MLYTDFFSLCLMLSMKEEDSGTCGYADQEDPSDYICMVAGIWTARRRERSVREDDRTQLIVTVNPIIIDRYLDDFLR